MMTSITLPPAHAELLRWLSLDFFDREVPPGYTERIDEALREAKEREQERIGARLELWRSGKLLDLDAILAEPSDEPDDSRPYYEQAGYKSEREMRRVRKRYGQ